MKKDIPPNKRALSRKEMLERHRRREYEDTKNELNDFSRRALAGLQYQPEEEPVESTLARLDRKLPPSAGRTFPLHQLLSIAAAVVLLLAAGYFVFSQPASDEALFAQHFDYLPSAVQTGSLDRELPATYDENAGNREKAMRAYEADNFQLARELMEKHLSKNSRDAEIRLYLGIVLLGEGEAASAISNLEAALDNLPRPAYERPARWYLALAFLRNEQAVKAKGLFQQLKEGKDRYATSARAVLKQM